MISYSVLLKPNSLQQAARPADFCESIGIRIEDVGDGLKRLYKTRHGMVKRNQSFIWSVSELAIYN